MNTLREIEKDWCTLLSRIILDSEDNAFQELIALEDSLKDLPCTNPEHLGRWIENCDFPLLIETLMLEDATFRGEFPNVRLTSAERKEFANALEAHCETCKRCHLKRSYDLEWQARMDKAIDDNREAIGEVIIRALEESDRN